MLLIPDQSKVNIINNHFSISNALFVKAEETIEGVANQSCICSRICGIGQGKEAVFIRLFESIAYFFKSLISCIASIGKWKVDKIHENLAGTYYSMLIFSETIFLLFKVIGAVFVPSLMKGIGTRIVTVADVERRNSSLSSQITELSNQNASLTLEVANSQRAPKYGELVKNYKDLVTECLSKIETNSEKLSKESDAFLYSMYESLIAKYQRILSLKDEILPTYEALSRCEVLLTQNEIAGEESLENRETVRRGRILGLLNDARALQLRCAVEEEEVEISESGGVEESESEETSSVSEFSTSCENT